MTDEADGPADHGNVSRRVLLRIALELLDHSARVSAHLERAESLAHEDNRGAIKVLRYAMPGFERKLKAFFDPERVIENRTIYAEIQNFAHWFYFAHELLTLLPRPEPSPEMFDVLRSAGFQGQSPHATIVLGPAFNAYEFDFVKHIVEFLPHELELRRKFAEAPFFLLAICDHTSPTAWSILGHEIGHAVDDDRSKNAAAKLEQRNDRPDQFIEDVAAEVWADLVGARLFGAAPMQALVSMEYCMLSLRESPWDTRFSSIRIHPPLSWRLRLTRSCLAEWYPDLRDVLAEEESAWMLAAKFHATISPPSMKSAEPDFTNIIQPLVKSLAEEVARKFPSPPVLATTGAALDRCQQRLDDNLPTPAQGLRPEGLRGEIADYLSADFPAAERKGAFKALSGRFREIPIEVGAVLLASHAVRQERMRKCIDHPPSNEEAWRVAIDDFAHVEVLAETSLIAASVHRIMLERLDLDPRLPEESGPAEERPLLRPSRDPKAESGFALLSDIEILERIVAEKPHLLFISPVIDGRQVGPSSFDVRLGTEFQIPRTIGAIHIDLTGSGEDAQKQVLKYFTRKRLPADGTFVLHPGEFALATTLEYFRLPRDIAARLEGRSTPARLGLQVHATAGFVDPGFEGTLTFELSNAGSLPIEISPGFRLGQLCFFRVGRVQVPYTEKERPKYARAVGVQLPRLDQEPELKKPRRQRTEV